MGRRDFAQRASLLLILTLGIGLRIWGLGQQILGGDELHLVRAVLRESPAHLLTHYGQADYCQPMAAFYRALSDAGLVLDELALRLLPLLSGILFLVIATIWTLRRFGWFVGIGLGWLIALHPLLISYSRMARSYMPLVLLVLLAVICFERVLRSRSWLWPLLGAFAAIAAIWFHLGSAPFNLGLILVLVTLGVRERAVLLRRTLLAAASAGVLLLTMLLPARESLSALLAGKAGAELPSLGSLVEAASLLYGTASTSLLLVMVAFSVAGVFALRDRAPRLLLLLGTAAIAQALSLLVFRPTQLGHPVVLARYQLVLAPWLLLLVAMGLRSLWLASRDWKRRGRLAVLVSVMAFAAGHVLSGPLLHPEHHRSHLQLHSARVRFTQKLPSLSEHEIPQFYRELGSTYPAGSLLELPWMKSWNRNRAYLALERIHAMPIYAAPLERDLFDERFRWRRFVAPELGQIQRGLARYLVVHVDPARDLAVTLDRATPAARLELSKAEAVSSELVRRAEKQLGAPSYRDDSIAVWELAGGH